MQMTLVVALGLLLAWLANSVGLAPIIGAFAAGLVLEPAFLEDFEHPEVVAELEPFAEQLPAQQRPKFEAVLARQREHHHQQLIEPLGHFTVPIFFVYTGLQVDLATLADLNLVLVALALTIAAFVGKIVAGFAAAPADRWIVGWGMAPRGEVGLIFAVVGKELGVVDARMFSVILVMVILTTLITPPVLAHLLRRAEKR
jgi:Kef-type K+ transport system membrane component KefB